MRIHDRLGNSIAAIPFANTYMYIIAFLPTVLTVLRTCTEAAHIRNYFKIEMATTNDGFFTNFQLHFCFHMSQCIYKC